MTRVTNPQLYDKLEGGLAQGVSTPLVNQMRVVPVRLLVTARHVLPELCAHLVRQLDAAVRRAASCGSLGLSQQPVGEQGGLLTVYDNYARLVLHDMWVSEAAALLSEELKGTAGSDDVDDEDEGGEDGAADWDPDGNRDWDRIERMETQVAHLLASAPFPTRRDAGEGADVWSAAQEEEARDEGQEEASGSGSSGAAGEQVFIKGWGQGPGDGSADRGAGASGEPRARILQALVNGPSRVVVPRGEQRSSSSGSTLHVIADSAWVNDSEGEDEELATALLLARLLPDDRGALARMLVRGPEALGLLLLTLRHGQLELTTVIQPVWMGQADEKEVRALHTPHIGPHQGMHVESFAKHACMVFT